MTSLRAASIVARKSWRTLEPYHGMIYFIPEAEDRFRALGIDRDTGDLGARVAPMGKVTPAIAHAVLYRHHPDLVRGALAGMWLRVTPEELLFARHKAVDDGLRRLLGDAVDDPEMQTAVDLLAPAVADACAHPEGRPLFAGTARIPQPETPHLALWWSITLLHEYRSDGRNVALVDARLSGLESLVLEGAGSRVASSILQSSHGWSDDEWDAGAERLRSRGLMIGDDVTVVGSELRTHLEERTDTLAAGAWAAIGEDDARELRRLVRPWALAIADQGARTHADARTHA